MTQLDTDLPWLNAEAHTDPDTAQQIIAALAERVQTLQRQTDELRADAALLKRSGGQQASLEQLSRLKTNLRDLRQLAARHHLDRDVVTLLSFAGDAVHLPAPAPLEQTLTLLTPPAEPVSALKPIYMTIGNWFGSLLVITSNMRMALIANMGLPISENLDWRDAQHVPILGLARAERVEAALAVDELAPPRDILLVTRRGWVRVISWSHAETLAYSGQSITLPATGDSPVWLGAHEADADILLLTRNGRWTRFPLATVPATGSMGIALDEGDDVVWALVIHQRVSVVWFVGADGVLFAVSAAGLEPHKRPGGKAAILARRAMGLACFGISDRKTEVAILLSNSGDLHVVNMRGLPIAARLQDIQPLPISNQRLIAAALL